MNAAFRTFVSLSCLAALGCAGSTPAPPTDPRAADAAAEALVRADFPTALRLADAVVATYPGDARAHAVRAIALYRQALHDIYSDGVTLAAGVMAAAFLGGGGLNQRFLDFVLDDARARLEVVRAALEVVAEQPEFSLELCLACWQVDWNRSGALDENDQRLLEIEMDAAGEPIPNDDPRRRPTFRFDVADAHWLRAMVSFQLAVLSLARAYVVEIDGPILRDGGPLHLRLRDAAQVRRARDEILRGLDAAEATHRAALAETDDQGEWLPNPRQKNHPLPLPVDDALFQTWAEIVADLRLLISGKQGLNVEQIAQLGDHQWADPPRGYIDIGKMFDAPADIVLNPNTLNDVDRDRPLTEAQLRDIFGAAYVAQKNSSGLPGRLLRMKREVDRGEEAFERKLRYLLWLN